MIPFPRKTYSVIYADPPWSFNFQKRKGLSAEAKSRLYPTMRPADIVQLPVGSITKPDSILFLWVMNSELPLALQCISTWGFTFKTVAFTWVKMRKTRPHFGGGNWTRSNPELCLLATKGRIKRVSASVPNLLISPLGPHSKKPDDIRQRIVQLVGNLPRIELFARTRVPGWDAWGNEV